MLLNNGKIPRHDDHGVDFSTFDEEGFGRSVREIKKACNRIFRLMKGKNRKRPPTSSLFLSPHRKEVNLYNAKHPKRDSNAFEC